MLKPPANLNYFTSLNKCINFTSSSLSPQDSFREACRGWEGNQAWFTITVSLTGQGAETPAPLPFLWLSSLRLPRVLVLIGIQDKSQSVNYRTLAQAKPTPTPRWESLGLRPQGASSTDSSLQFKHPPTKHHPPTCTQSSFKLTPRGRDCLPFLCAFQSSLLSTGGL